MIGEQIKAAREKKGWSQPMLAFASGVNKATICLIENGKRNPSDKTIKELFEALGSQ